MVQTCFFLLFSNAFYTIDEKLKPTAEKNTQLKARISTLRTEKQQNEQEKTDLVFFGLEKLVKSEAELVDYIKDIVIETVTLFDSQEISNMYRTGKKDTNKNRPVIVSVTSMWKKHNVLKNKSGKEISLKKFLTIGQLQTQVAEEKQKENVAYQKYDTIILKKPTDKYRDKRKGSQAHLTCQLKQRHRETASYQLN